MSFSTRTLPVFFAGALLCSGSDFVTVLAPEDSFKVPEAADSWSLQGVQSSGGHLYFLFHAPLSEAPHSALVETDTRGEFKHRLDLPGATIERFAVDESGRIMTVLHAPGPLGKFTQAVAVWDADGTPRGRGDASAAEREVELAQMGPAVVLSWVRISESQTAIVSRLTGRVAVIENGSVVTRIKLAAPEIDNVRRDENALTCGSVARDEQGRIYCMVSPFKRSEGPAILEFDGAGELLHRFRALPRGSFSPMGMVVVGDQLFLACVQGAETVMVQYSLRAQGAQFPHEESAGNQ